jgi:hypothetical protein
MFEDEFQLFRLTSRDFNGDRTGYRTQSSRTCSKNTLTEEKDSKCMHNVKLSHD